MRKHRHIRKNKILSLTLTVLVHFYRGFISPFTPASCRYHPTCSSYALILLRFDNVFMACIKIVYRILTCNPLFRGGYTSPTIYLSQSSIDRYKIEHFCVLKQHQQRPHKTAYFFVNSRFSLLKLQKFYIIPVYL